MRRLAQICAALGWLLCASSGLAQFQAPLILRGEVSGDQFGIAVASAGDFNGDGYGDLAVGANANQDNGAGAGKVYVFLGGPSPDTLADWIVHGAAGELLGAALVGAGDVNSDGYDDLLVGGPSNDQNGTASGRALLFLGGAIPDTVVDWFGLGEAAIDNYGSELTGGRDINGDDTADFIIGAYRFDPPAQSNTGKAYLYAGGALPGATLLAAPIGSQDGERFGFALSTAADFTGDGISDYLVGAYSYDSGAAGTNAGRVLLMPGGVLPSVSPAGELEGLTAGELFGWSLADAGDVDGDGPADFLVGAPGYRSGPTLDAGQVRLYFGGSALDSVPDWTVTGSSGQSDRLGFSLAGAVDLNKDGRSDFTIGAPGASDGGTSGKVLVYTGGNPPALDATLTVAGSGTQFGYSVTLIPNFFGSESALAVGAWAEDSNQGTVRIYRYAVVVAPCSITLTGDVDLSGTITAADIIYLVNFTFKGGPPPNPCAAAGDVNCSGGLSSADIIYLVNFVFKGGAPPCNGCASPLASDC